MSRYVEITLDKPRRLRFDINALADVEGVLGGGLAAVFSEQQAGIRSLRALLWAGLKWEDPTLTLSRVGELIQDLSDQGEDLTQLGQTINQALRLSGLLAGEAKNLIQAEDGISKNGSEKPNPSPTES